MTNQSSELIENASQMLADFLARHDTVTLRKVDESKEEVLREISIKYADPSNPSYLSCRLFDTKHRKSGEPSNALLHIKEESGLFEAVECSQYEYGETPRFQGRPDFFRGYGITYFLDVSNQAIADLAAARYQAIMRNISAVLAYDPHRVS